MIITLTLFAGSYICAFLMDDAMPANAKRRLDILHYGDYQDLAHFFGVRQLPPSFKLERMIDETGRKPDTEPILQYAITLDAPDLASLLSKKSIELHPAGMVDQKWVWDVFREKPSTDLLKYHRNGSTMIIDQSSSPTLKIYLSAWI